MKETVKTISEKTGRSERWIYMLCKKLGRLPTVDEVNERKSKKGRPLKYKAKEK